MATTEIQNTVEEETELKHEKLPNETLETDSIFDEHMLIETLDETLNPSSSSMQQVPSSSGAGLIDPQRKEVEELKENGTPCVEANAGPSTFTPVSYLQRKMRHAERFGISGQHSEEEKRYSRTERFRGPNMSIEEDVALCKAYISIAEDPVMGSELKKDKFWDRVFEAFVQLISNVNHRNATTLCNRFGVISKDVRHYVEKLAEVENRRQSGWTDVDVMRKARTEFQTTYRKSFQFEECHQILKAIPKYSVSTIATKMKNTCLSQKEGGMSSPSTPITHTSNMNLSDSPVDLEGPFEKLSEIKTEKKKARTKAKDPNNYESILEEIVSFNLFFKENTLQKKAQKDLSNDNMAQFLQIKLREVEDRVMAVDLNTVSGPQRVYFEQRQKEVLARHGVWVFCTVHNHWGGELKSLNSQIFASFEY